MVRRSADLSRPLGAPAAPLTSRPASASDAQKHVFLGTSRSDRRQQLSLMSPK